MIPVEAVEAAAKAIDASDAEGCGCCANPQFTPEDDKLADSLDINVRALLIAREALEAAAPYMQAGVKEFGIFRKGGDDHDAPMENWTFSTRERALGALQKLNDGESWLEVRSRTATPWKVAP